METNTITFEQIPAVLLLILTKVEALGLKLEVTTGTAVPNRLFTVTEAGKYLSLANSTLYGMTSRGEIDFLKKGKRVYFEESALLAYLQSGRRKSYATLAQEARQ